MAVNKAGEEQAIVARCDDGDLFTEFGQGIIGAVDGPSRLSLLYRGRRYWK